MRVSKIIIFVGAMTLFASGVCHAQLGGAAPLPEIKKSTGPTLEETTQWITEKFASLPVVGYPSALYGIRQHRNVVSFDDCDMTITESMVIGEGTTYRTPPELEVSNLQLREMDENVFEITKREKYSSLSFQSLGRLPVIRVLGLKNVILDDKEIRDKFTVKDGAGNVTYLITTMSGKKIDVTRHSTSFLTILFNEIEAAESMSNALKHAVMLCQQKAADEKAAQPPKKKDLF